MNSSSQREPALAAEGRTGGRGSSPGVTRREPREGDRRSPNRRNRAEDPPRTRQSTRTLAAFRPWGGWRDKRRTGGRLVSLANPGTARTRCPVLAARLATRFAARGPWPRD